jgi:hypothetical protein
MTQIEHRLRLSPGAYISLDEAGACILVRQPFQGVDMIGSLSLVVAVAVAGVLHASDGPGLVRTLRQAPPGAVIRLAPGIYSGVRFGDFHGDATIVSDDPAHPAVFTELTIWKSSGLTIKNVEFSTEAAPTGAYGPANVIPFQILTSSQMTFDHLNVHGSVNGSLATDVSGMIIRNSDHVTVSDSDFHNLHNGLQHMDDTFLTVTHNHFHHLRDDGFRGGGSSNVLVTDNHCDSNHPDGAKDVDHPDCIQFWTSRTTASAHDITITGNSYDRGDGIQTQGVFVKDDVGTLPFQRLSISGNTIRGALWNGILVDGAVDPVIENNIVCSYPDQLSWIRLQNVHGAELRGNTTTRFMYITSSGVKESHNIMNGDCHK